MAETAELLGVEASIGTNKLEIGSATKDFIAGRIDHKEAFLVVTCRHCLC